MRVAIWQGPSPAGDIDAAFATIGPALMAAGAMGAACLVLPEVYLPGYNFDAIPTAAQDAPNWRARLANLCRQANCGVVAGLAEPVDGVLYNSALALDSKGQTLADYHKIQLYGPREAALYTPGNTYVTFDLAGCKTALLICYDVEFAPHIAALASLGVQLILAPTANMHPFTHVIHRTVPAMAANHGVAIAYANFCGTEGDLTYVGGSLVAGPHGEILAQAGDHPALLIADIPEPDTARLTTQRADFRKV